MKIFQMDNKDKGFYTTMGPFLARREIEKEIGYKIYDDDGKVWFTVIDGKKTIGFCYRFEKSKGNYQVGSCYVVEEERNNGIFKQLLNEATKDIHGTVTLTTKNKYLTAMLINEGFNVEKAKGSFVEFRKEL